MLLRFLAPIVTVLAILASSVAAFAASGVIAQPTCCCPDPDTCKCHDHDGHEPRSELTRCAGEAELVDPVLTVALTPGSLDEPVDVAIAAIAHLAFPMPLSLDERPETPPF